MDLAFPHSQSQGRARQSVRNQLRSVSMPAGWSPTQWSAPGTMAEAILRDREARTTERNASPWRRVEERSLVPKRNPTDVSGIA